MRFQVDCHRYRLKNVLGNKLLLWIAFSLGLHIALLAWCPPPTHTIPPIPVYLVVELVYGSTSSTTPGNNGKGLSRKAQNQSAMKTLPDSMPEARGKVKPTLKKQFPEPKQSSHGAPEAQTTKYPTTLPKEPVQPSIRPGQAIATPNAQTEALPSRPRDNGVQGKASKSEKDIDGPGGTESGADNLLASSKGGPSSSSTVATPLAYGTNPPPHYPVTARRRGWKGEVMLRIEVLADGRVRKVDVARSSGFSILDEAAQNAVYRWRFKPARLDGQPVPGQVMVPVRFDLKKGD